MSSKSPKNGKPTDAPIIPDAANVGPAEPESPAASPEPVESPPPDAKVEAKASAPAPAIDLDAADALKFRALVREAESEVGRAEADYLAKAEKAKAAKKVMEAAVDNMRRVVRDRKPGAAPILDKIEKAADAKALVPPAEPSPAKPDALPGVNPPAWEGITVKAAMTRDAKLGPKVVEMLAVVGVETMGQLREQLSAGPGAIESLAALSPEEGDALAECVNAMCDEIGGDLRAAIARELLGFEPLPVATPPAKPRSKGKGRKSPTSLVASPPA